MKSLNWLAVVLVLCLLVSLAIVACGDDDDDDQKEGAADGGDDDSPPAGFVCEGEICTDTSTGLTWENSSTCCLQWEAAKTHCQTLKVNGYGDWRLPTISELRSLLRGCAATEAGGSCGVTDSCLTFDGCRDDSCDGCSENGGDGPSGLYWPPQMDGDCCWYWSSSEVLGDPITAWTVYFDYGYIYYANVYTENFVRCVR